MKKYPLDSRDVRLNGSTVQLDSWQNSTDPSKIDGSNIYDGTITNAKIADGTIAASKLASNAVYVRSLAAQIESKSGLAADSTGVKATSPKFTFYATGVKQLILRSSISSIPSDATVRVGVYDETSAAYVFYRDYAGATGENQDTFTGTMPSDGDVLKIQVEVTTASATSGATFDLDYASFMVDYGFS